MGRRFRLLPVLLLGGCYLQHGIEDVAMREPEVPADAARPDAGFDAGPPPPELVCLDDFDHAGEAERLAALVASSGFGAGAPEGTRTGRVVEVRDDGVVLEAEDGTRERFAWSGHPLIGVLEEMEAADWGVGPDGWHFVHGWSHDTYVWIRAFDGVAEPEPFWQRATEMWFEPACAEVDRCGDEVHQYALLVDRGWPPVRAAQAGERLDIETGTWLFLVAHVGSTDAALACGDATPRFRGVVTVISREPCVC